MTDERQSETSWEGPDLPSDPKRDLVFLMFRSVLRRDPAETDAAAFTHALHCGMSIVDFVSELMSTPEFNTQAPNVEPLRMDHVSVDGSANSDLLVLSTALLQSRLVDKGCLIPVGPTMDAGHDLGKLPVRAARLVRTLALLDLL